MKTAEVRQPVREEGLARAFGLKRNAVSRQSSSNAPRLRGRTADGKKRDTVDRNQLMRNRILTSAAEAFAAKGFEGARMDAIAAKARVNKAMIYYHMGGKDALYSAVLEELQRQALRQVASTKSLNASAEAELGSAIRGLIRAISATPLLPRLLLREMVSEAPRDEARLGILQLGDGVRSALEHGASAGIFERESIDIALVLAVGGALLSVVHYPGVGADQVTEAPAGASGEPDLLNPHALSGFILRACVVPPSDRHGELQQHRHIVSHEEPAAPSRGSRRTEELVR